MTTRKYTMRKRAASQEATRRKIVKAAVDLHGTLGPRNTSISAVAKRAGVRRLTVYRHFPDETALISACSSQWLSQHPPPDPAQWTSIDDPEARSIAALAALYGFYRETADILSLIYRDADEVEALQAPVRTFEAYVGMIRDNLVTAWRPKGRKPRLLVATVAHALAFSTWMTLAEPGLSDRQMARVVSGWIRTTAEAQSAVS